MIAKGMKHMLKEEVWQCAGTITNANNHCKFKAKKKRNLVSHIQQEHLADKVGIETAATFSEETSLFIFRDFQATSVLNLTVWQFLSVSTTSTFTSTLFMAKPSRPST